MYPHLKALLQRLCRNSTLFWSLGALGTVALAVLITFNAFCTILADLSRLDHSDQIRRATFRFVDAALNLESCRGLLTSSAPGGPELFRTATTSLETMTEDLRRLVQNNPVWSKAVDDLSVLADQRVAAVKRTAAAVRDRYPLDPHLIELSLEGKAALDRLRAGVQKVRNDQLLFYAERRSMMSAHLRQVEVAIAVCLVAGGVMLIVGFYFARQGNKRRVVAETALRNANEELERRVNERTASLAFSNRALRQEVQERVKANEQLCESERQFRTAIENFPSPVMIFDEARRVRLLSRGFTTYSGYPNEELRTIDDWLNKAYGEAKAMSEAHIQELFKITNTVVEGEWTIRHRNGADRIWDFMTTPLGSDRDGLRMVMSAAIDRTEQKWAEQLMLSANQDLERRVEERTAQLAEQTVLLDAIFKSMVEAVVVVDRRGKTLFCNPSGRERYGLEVGQSLLDRGKDGELRLGETEQLSNVDNWPVNRAIRGEEVTDQLTQWRRGRAGAEQWVLINATPVGTSGDGTLLVMHDVTARRQAERQLRERSEELARSNRELEQFAYVASHDLQEPLRAIAGCVQLFERKYRGQLAKDADDLIDMIVNGASRMKTLIDDLLTYSRAGRSLSAEFVQSDLVVKDVLHLLAPLIQGAGGEVTLGDLPRVRFPRGQLAQVLQNLISNAIKYRSEVPLRVAVSASRCPEGWVFCVSDNGIGLKQEDAEQIFGLFKRLHSVAAYPGTGIGLALVKKIVEWRGGRVWVKSELGQGSSFFFSVPDLVRLEGLAA